jgi:hypothetical protein
MSDPLFDSLFNPFRLPLNAFSFHLQLCDCNPKDTDDASCIAEYLSTNAKNNVLKRLDLVKCGFDIMNDSSWNLTKSSIAKMYDLCVVRVERLGISEKRLIDLTYLLLTLPSMQANPVDDVGLLCEINIGSNECSDVFMSDLRSLNNGWLENNPAFGVRKLVLNNNSMSDESVLNVELIMPSLFELHLAGNTKYTGRDLATHAFNSFGPLRLLNIDGTAINYQGIVSLKTGLVKRVRISNNIQPLQIWMRNLLRKQDAAWNILIDFCTQNQNRRLFKLKHDMHKEFFTKLSDSVIRHDRVVVRLFINGWRPVDVDHHDILSTNSVKSISGIAVDQINMLIISESGKCIKNGSKQLCTRYQNALRHVIESGKLYKTLLCISHTRIVSINKFTKQRIVESYSKYAIIGRPKVGWYSMIEVVTEESEDNCIEYMYKSMRR